MERFFALFRLGIRYLYRYRRRYYFLLAALVFGFAIVTFITSVKDGMYDSVYYSAQSHYAGDIVAAGYNTDTIWNYCRHMGPEEITAILGAADALDIKARYTILRTVYGAGSVIHYYGSTIRLTLLVGCD